MKRFITILAVALAVFACAQPAGAAAASNCAYVLVPVSDEAGSSLVTPELIGCYATYSAALSAGSDGAITVPSSMTPQRLSDAILADSTVDSDLSGVLIGTEWVLSSYAGNSTSYFAPSTCSSSQTWDLSYVGDAWNDRFNSGKGFGGCDSNKKFQDPNFGGTVLTCTPNCSGYGSLNNEVSSLRWKP
ncbi:MAG: hypothetical protein QOE83_1001 [Actinomycetota bacterium]|jgi:hypothetical protein|nr:hypothetical protein [Actinomycetota bacterium]